MDLKLNEKIQILRKRIGYNQGDFGAKAFNTSFESGRTKVKNIELGKQVPTKSDLNKMAVVFGIPPAELSNNSPEKTVDNSTRTKDGILVSQKVLDYFPNLGPYLDMLNKAITLEDEELIDHIAAKLALMMNPANRMADMVTRTER